MAQTLGQIPDFVNVGEVWQVWYRGLRENERCGCGQPFYSCEFWRAVGDEAFGGWDNVDVDKMVAFRPYLKRSPFTPHYALAANTNTGWPRTPKTWSRPTASRSGEAPTLE